MKAVVLEVRDGLAAVLREDGTVEKLRRDCQIGETIELPEEGKVLHFPAKATKWVAAAAAAVIVMTAGGAYGYNTAYAYSHVILDGDASVEYVLNRKDRVIRVNAVNEGGETLAEELNASGVKNATLSDAMAITTELLEGRGAENERGSNIVIRVSSRRDDREQRLSDELDDFFSKHSDEGWSAYVTNGNGGRGDSPARSPGEPAENGPTGGAPENGRQEGSQGVPQEASAEMQPAENAPGTDAPSASDEAGRPDASAEQDPSLPSADDPARSEPVFSRPGTDGEPTAGSSPEAGQRETSVPPEGPEQSVPFAPSGASGEPS